MTCEMLTDMGYSVVGPVSSIGEAVDGARDAAIDGAVVDLNLGGVMSYPVADELLTRGLPMIFLTGYDAATIDPRYAAIPLLQKPIDERMLAAALETSLGGPASVPKAQMTSPGVARAV
jgi:CheY-like chemotaxis protein